MNNPTPKRPRRQRKADRLTYSGASREEIECDYAVAPLDRLATKMDEKWGIDRLPELVSAETAQRYGSAMAKLNAALETNDPAEVLKRAQVCMRGLAAMDREATEAGQPQASADYWEYELEGFRFAIMRDDRNWMACKDARPDLTFFSLREVGVALKALKIDNPIFKEVKKHFPAAELSSIAARCGKQPEDPIPF